MSKSKDLNAIKRNLVTGRRAISEQSLLLDDNTTVKTLTVPDTARYALLVLEVSDPGLFTDPSKVARVTFSNTNPANGANAPHASATSVGIPMGHLDSWDIDETSNLQNFSILKTENVDNTGTYLHITYFV